jgi:hypothetical protein
MVVLSLRRAEAKVMMMMICQSVQKMVNKVNISGWWFGTWLDYDFPLSWEFHYPN